MMRLARLLSRLTLALLIIAGVLLWQRPVPRGGHPPDGSVPHGSSKLTAPIIGHIDHILIEKSARRLTLLQKGQAVRVWPIALGFTPEGDKLRQGDGKTPEGVFRIDRRNDRSAYHLSLGLDYPQPEDRARAKAGGYDPGGDIMIHGQPNSLPDAIRVPGDWTAGCIAVSNAQMRELWQVTDTATSVEIRP